MKLGLRHLSIRAKLALILGITIFALAATRALGLAQLGGFLDRFMAYTVTLETAQAAMAAVHAAEQGLARELIVVHAGARQAGGDAAQRLTAAADDADQALARLERVAPEVGLDAAQVRALRDAHRATRTEYAAALGTASAQGPALEHPQAAPLQAIGQRLAARFAEQRQSAAAAYATETRIMNGTYISMLVLVLGAGIVAYVLIAKMVTRPLVRMVEVANTVAAGDLRSRIEVTSEDELGQVMRALGDMNRGLARLIGEVRHASVAIGSGSGQIDSANATLADRMADQAAALEETATTMEQLTTTVGRNAEHARRAAESAEEQGARRIEPGARDRGVTGVRPYEPDQRPAAHVGLDGLLGQSCERLGGRTRVPRGELHLRQADVDRLAAVGLALADRLAARAEAVG